ncbi:complex I subunit 4 family protein [Thermofilum pendens]|uniref:Proton-translocating NADH-quinone oxidoreductase, chain M n=1 Tax=Thermofilum pendens (strain DSM 2475 / Hrk 5) TaxID=368408 RepID=A1RZ55_THEPD|nr:complex I subunit 5 family protein [Thermofilum pendens]ABL78485.1 proton-translocating NADH-quinone oxidoreductase, chain M [Thermofilum pendens Hrk 5]
MGVPYLWLALLVPLAASLASLALKSRKALAALNSSALAFSAAVLLLLYLTNGSNRWFDPLSFKLGSLGTFSLVMDPMVFLVAFSVAVTTSVIALYSSPYMEHRFEELEREGVSAPGWGAYYFLYTLFALSMMGTVMSTNIIEFYVFLELTLIPSFLLIAFYGYGERLKIAIMYLIWTHVGALLFLIGALTVGSKVGFDFVDPEKGFLLGLGEGVGVLAFWLMVVGLSVKLAAAGLHMWLPYAHAEAPTPISALLSPNLIGLGGAMMFRVVYVLFPKTFAAASPVLMAWALVTMIYGGLMALSQSDFKRLLAYSSISQMGYLLLGLASVDVYGVAGTFLHYMVHAFGKAILFAVAGILIATYHGLRDITRMGGLASKMPYTASLALIGFMHITGIPPTLGIWSEYLILRGAVAHALALGAPSYVLLAAALLVGIGLSTAYSFLTMRRVFYGPLKVPEAREAGKALWAPLLAFAVLGVLFFVCASLLIDPLVSSLGGLGLGG